MFSFFAPCKLTQTHNLLWQEGAYNEHIINNHNLLFQVEKAEDITVIQF